ncbi:DUF6327 family protein [Eudoraea sp.]|mgnify:CR=1 FL=1|uniref:DUF6327 family protein n=1 Tax=Eudoraea sp. TaxID=1979955 RepID=UPI003C766B98
MKSYKNFEEIEYDLKRLNLEREIALEELKAVKQEFKKDLQPPNWVNLILSLGKKYGSYFFIKKLLK